MFRFAFLKRCAGIQTEWHALNQALCGAVKQV